MRIGRSVYVSGVCCGDVAFALGAVDNGVRNKIFEIDDNCFLVIFKESNQLSITDDALFLAFLTLFLSFLVDNCPDQYRVVSFTCRVTGPKTGDPRMRARSQGSQGHNTVAISF